MKKHTTAAMFVASNKVPETDVPTSQRPGQAEATWKDSLQDSKCQYTPISCEEETANMFNLPFAVALVP